MSGPNDTTPPWHASGSHVYHVRNDCGAAAQVQDRNRHAGTGGNRCCIDCIRSLIEEAVNHP